MRALAGLSLLLVLCCSCGVESWWDGGHVLTAEIARRTLMKHDPKVIDEANKVFAQELKFFPYTSEMPYAATWSDLIKRDTTLMDNWHFINTPYNPENRTLPNTVKDGNVVWALETIEKSLKSTDTQEWGEDMSLRHLMHLMGDLHQPLHCATLYSKKFPDGDEGGNKYNLSVPGYPSILEMHALFDSVATLFDGYMPRPVTDDYAKMIQKGADQVMAEYPINKYPALANWSEPINYKNWSLESFALAVQYGYNQLPFGKPVNTTYLGELQTVLKERLALGGYRLALVMSQLKLAVRLPTTVAPLPTTKGPHTGKKYDSPLPVPVIAVMGAGAMLILVIVVVVVRHCYKKRSQYPSYDMLAVN